MGRVAGQKLEPVAIFSLTRLRGRSSPVAHHSRAKVTLSAVVVTQCLLQHLLKCDCVFSGVHTDHSW